MPAKFVLTRLRHFLRLEAFSGLLLVTVTLLAVLLANSPWQVEYHNLAQDIIPLGWGGYRIAQPLGFWINDGLMTCFFLLVGLEIKREFLMGELQTPAMRRLPLIAALGGMLGPAIIYSLLNWHNKAAMHGWAIPTATDIAFALGCLSLLGKRVPLALKVFLAALAIADDLGAILIIALFYTKQLHVLYGVFALSCWFILLLFNRIQLRYSYPYIILGVLLWFFILKSGIHPTIAGVLLALTIPLHHKNPLLHRWEKRLHPWTAYGILPLFAFINAGVSFSELNLAELSSSVPLGIILGLIIGKQVGIFSAVWLAIKLRWASLPKQMSWQALYGAATLCGIGFTMSLFIGELAFGQKYPDYLNETRFAILLASVVSGLIGYLILRQTTIKQLKASNDSQVNG